MLTAKDIMTKEVITTDLNTTVKDLALLLTTNDISGVPVVDTAGKLVGVVTQTDLIVQKKKVHIPTVITILDSVFYLESPDKMEQEIKKIAGTRVSDIYSNTPTTIFEDTPLDEIATIMSEKTIHTLPVISKDGTLKGIVGRKDIIQTIID